MTAAQPAVPSVRKEIIEGEIQPGDTITALLGKYFSDQELHSLTIESRKVFPLSGICSGQPYKLCVNDGNFERFEYDIDRDEQLIIRKESEGFDISRFPIAYTVKEEVVRGIITSSLFEAVSATGESDALAVMLADIFAYDIDFIRDIRAGDSFQVLVEKRFRDGKSGGYGRILGATFTNQGETYTAFLFKDGKNPPSYYTADGKALRKVFLKAPLAFSRISSGFTMKRFHPITKTWKAHPAIDYAAPTGTPIMAIGDGTIIKIGRAGGNGNHIKLRHSNGIESLYLHMSRFAKGMSQGKRVVQGQVIGYVGSTGLATGPHLCFRMYKNGSPLNPSKIKTAPATPVSREHMAEFKAAIAPRLARLQGRDMQQAELNPAKTAASDLQPPGT
jgi:murein DD-endopeptidase MepM/ murein hydrolase activator NlpD